jgi:hypothetical protein
MFNIVGEILAKLRLSTRTDTHAVSDPLAEKMRNLKWAATEDDRSAQKYLTEDGNGGKNQAPLAEIMASSYLGRSREPFE